MLLALTACGKSSDSATSAAESSKPATPPPASSQASDSQIDAEITKSLAAPSDRSVQSVASDPSQNSALADEAENILSRHPDKDAAELLNVPEVNEKLRTALKKLGENKPLQQQIANTVDLAARFKGLDGPPGFAKLDLDIKGYDRARKSRMLQAVISEDPRRIVDFLAAEIGEATPELSLGGVERAANGVSISKQPEPAAPK